MKKIGYLMAIILVFTSLTTKMAKAEEFRDSISATALSGESILFLQKAGIAISENSYIRPISIVDNQTLEEYSTVSIITPLRGNFYQQDILLIGNESGMLDVQLKENILGQKSYTLIFPGDVDTRYTISATAVYQAYANSSGVFVRPGGVYWRYSKLTTCTMNYISVKYECAGPVYSYPGFSLISSSSYYYSATAAASDPVQNQYYSKYITLASDRALCIDAGYPHGHNLAFDITINGSSYDYTVSLDNGTFG